MCAFLNSRGGILFVGVTDKGEIYGLDADIKNIYKSIDALQQDIPKTIKNSLGGSGFDFIMDIEELQGHYICVIKASHSLEPVFYENTNFYVRKGTSSNKLNSKETYDYIKVRFKGSEKAEIDKQKYKKIN